MSKIPKLFEYIFTKKLNYLNMTYIFLNQYEFIRKRNTDTNLVCYTHYILNILENCFWVDAIYSDFAQAFDSINHQILIKK